MIELYIENQKIDLTDDIVINFTYENIDPDKLSSIKNSFSKTVNIPGTPNNNKVFGYIFRYDKQLNANNTGKILNDYDPHKKVNWFINKNGSLVNRGYCTLDNIKQKNNIEFTYQITLYGGLGEFFYSLAYNEDGSEKTLYNLFWNWRPKTGINIYGAATTPEDENTTLLYKCEADTIAQGYHLLDPTAPSDSTTYIDRDLVFVPCYTGLYENFDSKSMLVSTTIQNGGWTSGSYISDAKRAVLRNTFPDSFNKDGKWYTTLDRNLNSDTANFKYGIVKFSRDLDPFEAGELRINEMPIAIRLSKMMNVISNPINNGGYEVEWDESIKNSPYWNYSWVMLGKLKQEQNEINNIEFTPPSSPDTAEIHYNYETWNTNSYNYTSRVLYDGNIEQGEYYLKTNYDPNLYFRVPWKSGSAEDLYKNISSAAYSTKVSAPGPHPSPGTRPQYWFSRVKNSFVILTTVLLNDYKVKNIANIIFLNNNNTAVPDYSDTDANYLKPYLSAYLNSQGISDGTIDEVNIKTLATTSLEKVSYSVGYDTIKGNFNTQEFTNYLNLTSYGHLVIKQFSVMCWNLNKTARDYIEDTAGVYGVDTRPILYGLWNAYGTMNAFCSLPSDSPNFNTAWDFYTNDDLYAFTITMNTSKKNGLFLNKTSGYAPLKIYKDILFANSQSPLKYLSSFCKLMNYKFICDNTEQKIYIKELKNYYINNIYDLSDKVDYNREINIKNITSKYKNINIGLDTPETYPVYIYNKNSKDKFNIKRYATKIDYPLPDTTLLDDLIYKNTIDWQQNSIFYNIYPQLPKAYNTTTVSWNLFNKDTDDPTKIQTSELFTLGVPSTSDTLFTTNDYYPKNALFNKENKMEDIESGLLFLNGFIKNYDYTRVEQSISEEYIKILLSWWEDDTTVIDGVKVPNSDQSLIWYAFDTSKKYYVTCAFSDSMYSNDNSFVVNYYDEYNNYLGGEYTKKSAYLSGGFDKVELHNIHPSTKWIECSFRNSDQTQAIYTKQETFAYIISPRLILSIDNYEQYYLNQGRCYQYDFDYYKTWHSWGYSPTQVGGSSTSWVLPMFSKDLYNTYSNGTNYEVIMPYGELNNAYVSSNDGSTVTDNNFEIFQYSVDPNKEYKFSARYSSSWSGIAVAYYDTADTFISSEYIVSSSQNIFTNADLTIPSGATKMFVNVEKIYSDVITVKELSESFGWRPSATKIASWNFTKQDSLDQLYDITNTNFVTNPSFNYAVSTTNMAAVNNNEYKLEYWPSDNITTTTTGDSINNSRIYDTKWKDYLDDLYDRNTRDVTLYVDLTTFGEVNNIMRNIYYWNNAEWVITKIENYKIAGSTSDKFTKVTMHKINNLSTWTN